MKEKLKKLLEKIGVLKIVWFFRYNFTKNVRRLIGRIKRKIEKYWTLRFSYPSEYKKYAKLPVEENKIIFIELRQSKLTNSFKVLYDQLVSKYDFKIHCHFLMINSVTPAEHRQRCRDLMRDMATAKYVFMNEASNVTSCVKLRPQTIMTQLWHGCGAFKKFGLSTAELLFGESRKEMTRFPYNKNYSYVTVSSPEVAWAYAEAMGLEDRKEIIVGTGSSRTDIFYDKSFIQASYDKLHTLMPSSIGKKVILYAPTFRGRVARAQTPEMLRVNMFKEAFEGEYVLLFKHHPHVKKPPVIEEADKDFAEDFTDAMTIEELLCVSDVCISDYSSLVFEYSIFEKPLIFFSYDLSEYFDWRGFYYDYDQLTPGPVFTTNLEIIEYIKHLEEHFDKQQIIDFKNKFMSACDGHATERIMDMVFQDALKTYKKEQPTVEQYHRIPSGDKMFCQQEERIDRLKWWKTSGNAAYEKFISSIPVVKGKIGVLYQKSSSDVISELKKHLKKEKQFTLSVLKLKKNKNDILKELASCEFVVLTEASDMMNVLHIRKETTVVQAWNEILPIEKFGYSSKEVRGGLKKDYLDVAPLHGNYQLIPMASENLKNIYKEAFRIQEENAYQALGAISTDVLFDESFIKNAKKKLDKFFPAWKGRKVIFYLPEYRILNKRPNREAFLDYGLMNEYLKEEYVMIYCSPFSQMVERDKLYKYYDNFIYDITSELTVYECMAAADIMIGDYVPQIYTFAVTDKPIFLYAPDYKVYFEGRDTYFDYEELAPGPICEDTAEIINYIQNIENYDDTKQKKFKDTYLTMCDGQATKRLLEQLAGMAAN